jgi:hypothetical protein
LLKRSASRHHDTLTIEHSIEKLGYRRARTAIGKQLKTPQLLVSRVGAPTSSYSQAA